MPLITATRRAAKPVYLLQIDTIYILRHKDKSAIFGYNELLENLPRFKLSGLEQSRQIPSSWNTTSLQT
jgi:hypothetical protein